MKKRNLPLVIFILFLFSCSAGKKENSESSNSEQKIRNKITVGVSLLTQAHPFQQAIETAIQKEAEAKNVNLNIGIAEQDLNKQISQVEDFITQKCNVIILVPVDSDGIKGAILKANAANIPVITVDIKANGAKVATHIATDNYSGGKIAAEAMAQLINKIGEIALIDYPEVQSVRDRINGFKDQIKNYPNIKIVSELPGRTREEAKKTSEDMLTANPNLKGIFGFGDDMAISATNSIKERKSKAVVVGFDGLQEAISSVDQDNAFLAVVRQFPSQMGKTAIDTAVKLVNKETTEKEIPIVPGLYVKDLGNIKIDNSKKDFGLMLKNENGKIKSTMVHGMDKKDSDKIQDKDK